MAEPQAETRTDFDILREGLSELARLTDPNSAGQYALALLAIERKYNLYRIELRDIRDNYDHDEDAHRHGTNCRACSAAEVLGDEPA